MASEPFFLDRQPVYMLVWEWRISLKNIVVKPRLRVSWPGRGLTGRVTGRQKWRNHQPGEPIQGRRAAASVSKRPKTTQNTPALKPEGHTHLYKHTHTRNTHTQIQSLGVFLWSFRHPGFCSELLLFCNFSPEMWQFRADAFLFWVFSLQGVWAFNSGLNVSNYSTRQKIYDPLRMPWLLERQEGPHWDIKGGHRRSETLLEGEKRKILLLLLIWWVFIALSSFFFCILRENPEAQRSRFSPLLTSKTSGK